MIDGAFGAMALAIAAFSLLEWCNAKLDRSTAQPVLVTPGARVSAGRAGMQRVVVVFGKLWLLSDRLAGPCRDASTLTLEVSAGALGQRWVRGLRCA